MNENPNNEMEYDIVTLYDEDNNAVDYAVIDGVEYNDTMYLALVEASQINNDECEFLILRQSKQEEDLLETIEDEKEFNEVMELFNEKLDEEYDIETDSEEE